MVINVEIKDMKNVENTQECFVQLWRMLERTRRLLGGQYKRFCIRRVLQSWFGARANDDFIWEVCNRIDIDDDPVCAYDELPPPSLNPRVHRELLRATVSVCLGIGIRKVNLKWLDQAYSIAFPGSTPINVNKKKGKRKSNNSKNHEHQKKKASAEGTAESQSPEHQEE